MYTQHRKLNNIVVENNIEEIYVNLNIDNWEDFHFISVMIFGIKLIFDMLTLLVHVTRVLIYLLQTPLFDPNPPAKLPIRICKP
jgi:hypothetical protein